jgi:hypothetical protein
VTTDRFALNQGILPYDPGLLPNLPAPAPGETISVEVSGLPPRKEVSRSIRNPLHPRYEAFGALRAAATEAMGGRAWWFGPVRLELVIHVSTPWEGSALDYIAGIQDTLDGCHGLGFTYLPIAFEDDQQVVEAHTRVVESTDDRYEVKVTFLDDRR